MIRKLYIGSYRKLTRNTNTIEKSDFFFHWDSIYCYLLYFHCRGEISTFPEFIDMGILALFLSVINLFISFFIIKHLLEVSSAEDEQLKYLEDKLRELDDAK